MYDYVLFDLDGTLTDSAKGILASVDYAVEKMGLAPIPPEKRRLYIGPPLLDSFQRINGMTVEESYEGVRLFRERYNRIGWMENRVYEGIPHMLRALKSRGVYLGVATAKPVAFAEMVLKYFGLTPYFDAISSAPMDESGLPKEELIRCALPAGAKNVAMVGDRLYDMEGAHRAGVSAIGALYGYGSRDELERSGADHICETPDDLARLLLDGENDAFGTFISFEGIDGCGKTTQVALMQDWLRECGWRVLSTREPGGSPIGEKVRQILIGNENNGMTPECEALLFAAARAQHTDEVLRPALKGGCIVLGDRYVDSSIAYQGWARGLGEEKVRAINSAATRGLEPELTLLFDISPDEARHRRRGEDDRIEREKMDFHNRVREGFNRIAAQNPERVKTIDASKSVQNVFECAKGYVMDLLARRAQPPEKKGTIYDVNASKSLE